MKKIELIAVGGVKEEYFRSAIEEYAKRLTRFCDFKIKEIKEHNGSGGQAAECKEILSAVDGGAVILLDIDGDPLSSEGFSALLDGLFITASKITFIIGGSTGVNAAVKSRADKKLSFGKITYPHTLIRVIFTEQLYRAFTITAGMPYHK